jgi:hypothetical protein
VAIDELTVGGGEPVNLTAALDRPVQDFRWSPDGKALHVLYADAGVTRVAALPAGGWVVGWSAYDPDNNAYGLYTRPYSASGVAGSPVRVGPEASGDPWSPAVAGPWPHRCPLIPPSKTFWQPPPRP